MDQYAKLISLLPNIEKTLVDRKETVPRPEYGESSVKPTETVEEEGEKDDLEEGAAAKPNFAATDDESED